MAMMGYCLVNCRFANLKTIKNQTKHFLLLAYLYALDQSLLLPPAYAGNTK